MMAKGVSWRLVVAIIILTIHPGGCFEKVRVQ